MIKKHAVKFLAHPVISGGAVIFIGSMAGNLFQFLFNLFMSRNLSVENYGVLTSFSSILTLFLLIAGAFTPTVVRFAASSFAKNDLGMARGLFRNLFSSAFIFAMIIFIVFTLFSNQIAHFLQLEQPSLIVLCGFTVFIGVMSIINSGFLQAKLAFGFLSIVLFIGSVAKFSLGVGLYFLNFGVFGAVWALTLSTVISYSVSFFKLKFVFAKNIKTPKINTKEIILYAGPAAITMLSVTALITSDILLVKHFFSPQNAGIYSGLTIIGRIIFYISVPVGMVMFPLVTQRHEKKEDYASVLMMSLFLVLAPAVILTIGYYLFPNFIILFFIKKVQYLHAAPLLGMFGIFMSIYSVVFMLVNYFLSIKKTNIWFPLLISAVAHASLIWLYHRSFSQVIFVSICVTSALLIYLISYYFKIRHES